MVRQTTKMWLSDGYRKRIYWIQAPQTDLTSMKMTKYVAPFCLYLFMTFFSTYSHNKVFSGDLFQTLMTPVINLCLVGFVRTMKTQNIWDEFQTSCAVSPAEVILRTLSQVFCLFRSPSDESSSLLSPWAMWIIFSVLIVKNPPSTSHLHHPPGN